LKLGIVDVGGGLRDIYAAGVLDACLDRGIAFDLCIGVSAGSANLTSFLAGQRGRNLRFYTEYSRRSEYMSPGNYLRTRSYLDLDYIYGTLSRADGEDPLDYPAFASNPAKMITVACDARTGEAHYFGKESIWQDHYDVCKASSAIPFVCRPYVIYGVPYYDGALGDPVPVQKAFDLGCDRVVVVLSRPVDRPRTEGKDGFFAERIEQEFPKAAESLRLRARRYNEGVVLAQEYARRGRVLIVSPRDTHGVKTLSRDLTALEELYRDGLRDGGAIPEFLARP